MLRKLDLNRLATRELSNNDFSPPVETGSSKSVNTDSLKLKIIVKFILVQKYFKKGFQTLGSKRTLIKPCDQTEKSREGMDARWMSLFDFGLDMVQQVKFFAV